MDRKRMLGDVNMHLPGNGYAVNSVLSTRFISPIFSSFIKPASPRCSILEDHIASRCSAFSLNVRS